MTREQAIDMATRGVKGSSRWTLCARDAIAVSPWRGEQDIPAAIRAVFRQIVDR